MRGQPFGCIVAIGVLASVAHASPVLDKPAFTATPAELQSLAKATPHGDGDVVVLREDHEVSYDDRGRMTSRWRLVFVVATLDAMDDWSAVPATWQPSFQDKPKLRARVIDASGRVLELDQSLVSETHDGGPSRSLPGDRRYLEAPLPRLTVGAVVEQEVTTVDREPLLGGGAAYIVRLSGYTNAKTNIRVKLSSPATRKLRVLAHGLPAGTKPRTETAGGRTITTYSIDTLPAQNYWESFVPGDARPFPQIIVSSVASWSVVAREYRALIDKRIGEGAFTLPAELPKTASIDTARKIVAWLQRQVSHNGAPFDGASIVPSTPADVVKRGIANEIDTATLLVALLRQAGIRAELALIKTGPGSDLDRDVPALNVFDHAIVRARIGKSEVWIDPTERGTQPGRLPVAAQNRLALVIADDSTALIASPSTPVADNVVRVVRTFDLAEFGNAKVTEVSREGGVFEAEERAWVLDSGPDSVRKRFAAYAENRWVGTFVSYSTTPPDDFTKPFETTVVASSPRGYSDREGIDVYLWPTDALEKLPYELGNPYEKAQARKHAFVMSSPHTYEIENRLVLPSGFTMPKPAADKTRELGPIKLVEKQRIEGHTFIVTFRLDATRVRLTPAEVTKVQEAVRALRQEDAQHVAFPLTAHALADNGKFRDAIVEVNKLINAHPKEAVHHQQLAHVLIKAGAGDAARRAARKAVELEPKNADAHVVLGWILQHDTFGNWLGFDHDHTGAVAALKKARSLDPKHVGAVADLARALQHNAKGRIFDSGSDVRGAVEAWRTARTLEDTTEHAYALAVTLAWSGNVAEAEKILRGMRQEERRDQLLTAVTALTAGPDAAIRFAASLGASSKGKTLAAAAAMLMLMRRYEPMRALFAEAKTLQPGTSQAILFEKLGRDTKSLRPASDPGDLAIEMSIVMVQPERKNNVYWDKATRDDMTVQARTARASFQGNELMTSPLVEDLLRAGSNVVVEGDPGLWRVEMGQAGQMSQVYVASDRGIPKVIGASDAPQGVGRHVLRLLAKNDEKSASRLLDWLARDLGARARKDQNTHAIASLWGGTLPRTRSAMEVAAAVLAGESDAARARPILEKCKPTTTDGQLACDWVLADVYRYTRKWVELEEHGRAWAGRSSKKFPYAVNAQATGLAWLGRFDDADRVLADALTHDPGSRALVYMQAEVAIARGKLADAVKLLESIAKPGAKASELNNTAWLKLIEGSDLQGAATIARNSLQIEPNRPHALNTLAAIEAELGELGDARRHLLDSMRDKKGEPPSGPDFYVHGRILEQLGLTADAITMYRRVKRGDWDDFIPVSADLAARRLTALGVKK